MQIYLLFPVFRWVLRKTEGYHRWLLAAAVAYQLWLTCALHYHLGRPATGPLAQWLNGAGQGIWVDSYLLYVVAGAIAGWHFEQICAFTRRHLGTAGGSRWRPPSAWSRASERTLIEIYGFGATPANASAVFQPIVVVEALAFGWALLGAGLLWSDRGAPHRKFCAAGLGQLLRDLPGPPARAPGADRGGRRQLPRPRRRPARRGPPRPGRP